MEKFCVLAPKNVQRGTHIFQKNFWSLQEKHLEHQRHRAWLLPARGGPTMNAKSAPLKIP